MAATAAVNPADGATDPPPMSFGALYYYLTGSSRSQRERVVGKLLNEHLSALRTTITDMVAPGASVSAEVPTANKIKFRPGTSLTKECPKPTQQEVDHAQAVAKMTKLSFNDVLILVRDVLLEGGRSRDRGVKEILKNSELLSSYAFPDALLEFRREEQRHAWRIVTFLMRAASPKSEDPLQPQYAAFLNAAGRSLHTDILSVAGSALKNHSVLMPGMFEALFAACMLEPYEYDLVKQFIIYLVDYPQMDRSWAVDGADGSAALVAFLWSAFDSLLNSYDEEDFFSSWAFRETNRTLADVADGGGHAELALVRFGWAVFSYGGSGRSLWRTHLEYAMEFDAFTSLNELVGCGILAPEVAELSLHILEQFLTLVLVRGFAQSQIQVLVSLITNCMSSVTDESRVAVINTFWLNDKDPIRRYEGLNLVMRMTEALWPDWFGGFADLLALFIAEGDAAQQGFDLLSVGLHFACEGSDYSSDELERNLSQDSEDVRLAIGEGTPWSLMIWKVSLNENSQVTEPRFCHALCDLPGTPYRGTIARGTLGYADEACSRILWPIPPNGVSAVAFVVRSFLDLTNVKESRSQGEDVIELPNAAFSAFRLLAKFAQDCTSATRNLILDQIPILTFIHAFNSLAELDSSVAEQYLNFTPARQRIILRTISVSLAFLSEDASVMRDIVVSSFSANLVHVLIRNHGAESLSIVAPFLFIARMQSRLDPEICNILLSSLIPLWLSSDEESAECEAVDRFRFVHESLHILERLPSIASRSPIVSSLVSHVLRRYLRSAVDDSCVIDCLHFCVTAIKHIIRHISDDHIRYSLPIVRELSTRESVNALLLLAVRSVLDPESDSDGADDKVSLLSLNVLECLMFCLNSEKEGMDSIRQIAFKDPQNLISAGFTRLVLQGNSSALRFVAEVIDTGQRSLARGILNPVKGGTESVARSAFFQAVVDRYVTAVGELEAEKSSDFAAMAVRFLRLVWESFRSVWVEAAWERNGVWTLLGTLISCKTGPSWVKDRKESSNEYLSAAELKWSHGVADALALFASEILFMINGGLHQMRNEVVESSAAKSETKDIDLRSMFESSVFKAFRSSVSESWLTLFVPYPGRSFSQKCEKNVDDSWAEKISIGLNKQLEEIGGLKAWYNIGHLTYGKGYLYDVEGAVQALIWRHGRKAEWIADVRTKLFDLNMYISGVDSKLVLLRAFGEAALSASFADAVAPAEKELLRAIPYFNGKLSRVLSHSLLRVGHNAAMLLEISRFLAFVSPQITTEEFEQPVLTTITRDAYRGYDDESLPSPLRCIASALDILCEGMIKSEKKEKMGQDQALEAVQWLLLSGSHLSIGTAFSSEPDKDDLANLSITLLSIDQAMPRMIETICVALSRVTPSGQSLGGIKAALSNLDISTQENSQQSCGSRSAEALLNTLSTMDRETLQEQRVLAWLNSGIVRKLLIRPCHGYYIDSSERSDDHRLLCSTFSLAARLLDVPLAKVPDDLLSLFSRDVLEFASCSVNKMCSASLDLSGDWPPAEEPTQQMLGDTKESHSYDMRRQVLTLARVEEAELAAHVVFSLSAFTGLLHDELPEVLERVVNAVRGYIHSAYRLMRAEPVERWIRPVSKTEVKRSMGPDEQRGGLGASNGIPIPLSPWALTPPGTPKQIPSSPRRSPLVAIYASLGSAGKLPRGGHVPPSPGMPMTPLQTPSAGSGKANTTHVVPTPSPLAEPYSSGLIISRDLTFGEEASRSIMRGLAAALGALRRIGQRLDVPLFSPSLQVVEKTPSIGLLVAIQYHSCVEVYQRKAEGERRDNLLLIIDNAMRLTLSHLLLFRSMGVPLGSAKDDVKKRLLIILSRLRKAVPPPPSYSIIHSSQEIEAFLNLLQ